MKNPAHLTHEKNGSMKTEAAERREKIIQHLQDIEGWEDKMFFSEIFGVSDKTIYRDLAILFRQNRSVVFDEGKVRLLKTN